jgi:ABC transport system ATP-binding/permease protein
LLVSHDRTFLDNVVTSTLVFEGNGKFGEYAGGYEDWERYQRPIPALAQAQKAGKLNPQATAEKDKLNETPRKLTYKEQRERQNLPDRIEALEAEQGELHKLMGEADFYRQPGDKIAASIERLETLKRELEDCYERWQFLESLANGAD